MEKEYVVPMWLEENVIKKYSLDYVSSYSLETDLLGGTGQIEEVWEEKELQELVEERLIITSNADLKGTFQETKPENVSFKEFFSKIKSSDEMYFLPLKSTALLWADFLYHFRVKGLGSYDKTKCDIIKSLQSLKRQQGLIYIKNHIIPVPDVYKETIGTSNSVITQWKIFLSSLEWKI